MTEILDLGPNLLRIYTVLRQKAGETVPYAQLENLLAGKNRRNMLAVRIHEMRKRGIKIQTISNVGYRLKLKKTNPMQVIDVSGKAQDYANDIQAAIHGVMAYYGHDVGFESQMAIMGVAIGAILHQLPTDDRKYFTRIIVSNIRDANEFSALIGSKTLQ